VCILFIPKSSFRKTFKACSPKYSHFSERRRPNARNIYSDHKNFEQILVETTEIDIKEEFVADPLAIDINDKEVKVKQER
jgi:hypothetical protein